MTSAKHVMIVASAAALALAVAAAPTLARQPAPQPTAQEQPAQKAQASMVRGELMKVDTAAKTIAVKPADGPETTIRYDDKTVVTGAERGIEGLANTSGTQVSATVSGEGAERLATAIRILPKM